MLVKFYARVAKLSLGLREKEKGGLTVAAKKEFFETGNNMARLL